MLLNIYYSKNLKNLTQFQDFFMNNYFFKDEDILSGRLCHVCFFNIENYQKDEESIAIVLIDEYLIDEIYEDTSLQKKILEKWNGNKKVIFVGLSENCTQLKIWGDSVNFIRAFKKENIFDFLYTEITHDVLRFILEKEKLNIFISHAKKDGREIAKLIKEFIDNDVKLGNFFDETDIQSSDDWKKILEDGVEKSLFLFVYSDNYAHTVWTQKEIIWAKKRRVPIVGIDVLAKEDKRMFPYISNVRMVKLLHKVKHIEQLCDNNFSFQTEYNLRLIINALLKEALQHYLFIEEHNDNNYLVLTKSPELFDICQEKNKVLYPDPPLMFPERDLLEDCIGNKELLTPLMINSSILKNKKISISISESNNLVKNGYTIEHLNMFMIELARYLFIENNTLIYGGDLGYRKEFNFTQLLVEVQEAYNSAYEKNHKEQRKQIINFSANPFFKNIDIKIKNRFRDVINFEEVGEECTFQEVEIITKNLTKMRELITKEMDIKIAVGGKITGFVGFYPGILEEVYLAIKSGKPTCLVCEFGGITERIIHLIEGKETQELTFEYQQKHTKSLKKLSNQEEKEIETRYKEMYDSFKNNKSKNIFISKNKNMDSIISFLIKEKKNKNDF